MKEFFRHLSDFLFPPVRKDICPHCGGGGRCFGMCALSKDAEAREAETVQKRRKEEAAPCSCRGAQGPD